MELSPRQSKAVRKLDANDGGALWWRVGTGKTRIAFGWFATIAKSCLVQPRFIVVCRRAAFDDWREEMYKLGLKWRTREVENENDLYVKTNKPIVYIISHGMLSKLDDSLKNAGSLMQAIALDEGFLYKNPGTKHCKAANRIAKTVGRAAILSGSVMTARDPTDVYGQLYAINRHHALGRTLTNFRSRYMSELKIQMGTREVPRIVARKGAAVKIAKVIAPFCSFYFPTNNQREIVSQVKEIPATKEQTKAFKDLRELFELELKGKRLELKNAPSVITKCQQISDGFVKMEQDIIPVMSTKLDMLLSQTCELVACGERLVIWCAFKHTVTLILQALQKAMPSVHAYGLHGSLSFDLAGWQKNGQVAVATVASGSSINHFRNCSYAIYYSHSFHWLHMQQSRGRTNRHDSLHKTCFYYYLQTTGSLDSFVYRIVNQSSSAEKHIIEEGVNAWLNYKKV